MEIKEYDCNTCGNRIAFEVNPRTGMADCFKRPLCFSFEVFEDFRAHICLECFNKMKEELSRFVPYQDTIKDGYKLKIVLERIES